MIFWVETSSGNTLLIAGLDAEVPWHVDETSLLVDGCRGTSTLPKGFRPFCLGGYASVSRPALTPATAEHTLFLIPNPPIVHKEFEEGGGLRSLLGLAPYLGRYRWRLAAAVLCAVGATAMSLSGPLLVRELVGVMIGTGRSGGWSRGRGYGVVALGGGW